MLRGVSGQRVFGAPSQVRRVTCKKSAPVNAPMVRAVPGKVAVPATTAIAFAKPSSGDSGKSSRGDNVVVSASASNTESAAGKPSFISKNQLLTIFYIGLWYLFNVQFNIANKSLYKQFPFPWFVSCVHLAVGILVMGFCWGTRVVEWQTPSKQQYKDLVMPGFLHAFGHCLTNVSFAAVAVSFTHTVKTLEPLCSAAGMYLVNGIAYPWPVYASLVPVMLGVAIASTSELSFNWLGFLTAMGSNISFAGRAITSKPLMSNLSSINVYNWVALIALVFCIPPTIYFEGSQLPGAIKQACSSMGTGIFLRRLLEVGFFYHMYNQVAYQALGKVEPVTHAVANVGKRIFVIGFSILAFGNPITAQTAIGSSIAIFGAFAYSYLKAVSPTKKVK